MKHLGFCLTIALSAVASFSSASGGLLGAWDITLEDFPRLGNENTDAPRIRRAIESAGVGGVAYFTRGEYEIDSTVVLTNQVSLLLHKSACLKAVKKMPFIIEYHANEMNDGGHEGVIVDHNLFIKGGIFDGNGLASCAVVSGPRHFMLADTTYRNGLKVGLQLGYPDKRSGEGGYEIFANNLYFICNRPGMAGNVGFLTYIGDSHFTDLVVVDYTVGIRDMKFANRYTRCHVWGGPVRTPGTEISEYLVDSISFDIAGYGTILTDCYADTAMIGFNISSDARLFGCSYNNNYRFKMDGPTCINHIGGELLVYGGFFPKSSPNVTLYRRGEKRGSLIWRDNQLIKFTAEALKPIELELKRSAESGHICGDLGRLAD